MKKMYRIFTLLIFIALSSQCSLERSDTVHHSTTIDYNDARYLRVLFRKLVTKYKPSEMHGVLTLDDMRITIDAGHDELTLHNPCKFDSIEIIEKPEAKHHVKTLVQGTGVGLPLVMMQKYNEEKASPRKLFPLNGRNLPATLTAEKNNEGLVLRFYHTRNLTTAIFNQKKVSLAYDLSTPLERSMSSEWFGHTGIRGLLYSNRYLENLGIYLPDVYDPKKIPVVFVHGLNSDPHIWQNAMNEVLANPELRKKYQCWYFLYPTGLPIYASAEKLRHMLYEARNFYDPAHNNPNMNRMVLVGHSMGGILSRMQAIDSGNDIYAAFFTKPLDQIPLKPMTKTVLQKTMFFERVPFVKRVVFVASPHQGSSIAEIPIMHAFNLLIHPTTLLDSIIMDIRVNGAADLNPDLWKFRNLGCRSVQTLSPHHPLLKALQKRKIQVPYHTIIARKQKDCELSMTSDGVVAYWSSHVPNAVSEKPIAGTHSCTGNSEVAEEIIRILQLHANH